MTLWTLSSDIHNHPTIHGRFTRSDPRFGAATLIANLGETRVQEAIEDLYAEDADWDTLIPDLSARAIGAESEIEEFVDQMRAEGPDEGAFSLAMLRPKTSAVMFRVHRFTPRTFHKGLSRTSKVHRAWTNDARNLVVFITRTPVPIGWAKIKEVSDEIWDLYILSYDASTQILYIYSSKTSSLHSSLARSVSGQSAQIIDGERMFRALADIKRLVFHNVGLYGRGKLRFRMFTGYDISDAISPLTQANATKSNIFGVGYEKGKLTTIGVSAKGRLWSMSSSSIPLWIRWSRTIAKKILNPDIRTDAFLAHTLIPRPIASLPSVDIIAILLPDEWLLDAQALHLISDFGRITAESVGIAGWTRVADNKVECSLAFGAATQVTFMMAWQTESFTVQQVNGVRVLIDVGEGEIGLSEHFSENPPIVLMADGSEARGSKLLERRAPLPTLFESSAIRTLDWAGIPLRVESKWRLGQLRDASVQGRLIDERVAAENSFVFDDDDAGEVADVIEILEAGQELLFRLYHCKFSTSDEPGVRVDDLYVVCGQAIRSTRVVHDPEALLVHMERRETPELRGGRPSRLEKGELKDLRRLRRRVAKLACRFEVLIVQPGLSKSALSAPAATVLAAADMFVREFTTMPLVVYASP